MNKIDYAFTAVPSNFIYLFDNSTFKLITFFIYKKNYFNSVNKLDDEGYFYISNKELQKVLNATNKKVISTIDALYKNDLIDVRCDGFGSGKRHTNRYKLNTSKIEELAQISMKDIINSNTSIYIKQSKRDDKCSYINDVSVADCNQNNNTFVAKCHRNEDEENNDVWQNATENNDTFVAKCHTTLYYNNINDIIDINVYNTNNINEEETVKNDNNTSNIEDNNDESIEDYYKRMYEEEKEIIDEMNKRFEGVNIDDNDNNNFNDKNDITIDDLPLQQWITKLFNNIDTFNDKFFKSRTVEDAKYYSNELDRLFEKAQQYQDVFTDKQYKLLQTKADRCLKIDEQKYNYFNGRKNKGKHSHQSSTKNKSIDVNPESRNYSAPTPPTPEDVHNQMMEDLINRF